MAEAAYTSAYTAVAGAGLREGVVRASLERVQGFRWWRVGGAAVAEAAYGVHLCHDGQPHCKQDMKREFRPCQPPLEEPEQLGAKGPLGQKRMGAEGWGL